MEKLIYKSPVVQDSIEAFKKEKPIEGNIVRMNVRGSDLFFNSRFESGNLKQVFIEPQPSDYEDLLEDEMVIPDELADSEIPSSSNRSSSH
jgi:hypothetical protein